MAAQQGIVLDDTYDYVTYTGDRPECASCGGSLPNNELALRGMIAPKEGPPTVGYWHPRCKRPEQP